MEQENKGKILVGMSGGVDSSVCAWLLKKQGYEVLGVHFLMSGDGSLSAAKKVAEFLGIRLIVEDISKEFQKKVIDDFVEKYSQGETPNPCVICNKILKYQKLIEIASKNDIGKVATGHYARIVFDGDSYSLLKGKDGSKDQSYFLYRLGQEQLAKTVLPLGGMKKAEVKKIAVKAGLPVENAESQDVCFFAKQDSLSNFLEKYFRGHPGKIVDDDGVELGKHKGVEFFTVGQRRGLNVGGGGPYYVFDKDNKNAVVKVTSDHDHPSLLCFEIEIGDLNWISRKPEKGKIYQIKTRYQMQGSEGEIGCDSSDKCIVALREPQWAVAKGQSLVVFDGERVVGGGIIIK